MKKFLEEYSFGILIAIVVIILIGISTPVGNLVKESVSSVVSSLGVRTDSRLAAVQDEDLNVLLRQDGAQLVVDVLSESTTDVFAIGIKEVNSNSDMWIPLWEADTGDVHHKLVSEIPFDPTGQRIQVRAVDTGRNRNGLSNIINLSNEFSDSDPFEPVEEESDVYTVYKTTVDIPYHESYDDEGNLRWPGSLDSGSLFVVRRERNGYSLFKVLVLTESGKYKMTCMGGGWFVTDEYSDTLVPQGTVNWNDVIQIEC